MPLSFPPFRVRQIPSGAHAGVMPGTIQYGQTASQDHRPSSFGSPAQLPTPDGEDGPSVLRAPVTTSFKHQLTKNADGLTRYQTEHLREPHPTQSQKNFVQQVLSLQSHLSRPIIDRDSPRSWSTARLVEPVHPNLLRWSLLKINQRLQRHNRSSLTQYVPLRLRQLQPQEKNQ